MAYIATFVSVKSFTIVGDKTEEFLVNRRVRCNCGVDGYKYGTIESSSYSSPSTTIGITGRSADLTSNLTNVDYGIVSSGPLTSLPQFPAKENLLINSGLGVWSNSGLAQGDGTGRQTDYNVSNIKSDTAWTGATGATPPTGWTVGVAATYTIASGELKIEHNTSNNNPQMRDTFTTVVGKLYMASATLYTDGSATAVIGIGTAADGTQLGSVSTTSSSSSNTASVIFEASATTTHIYVEATTDTGTEYILIDDLYIDEVVPGCVGSDALGPDGWAKDASLSVWREHNGTNTKEGSFYAIKGSSDGGTDRIECPIPYAQGQGRTMTFGAWAKTSTASNARLRIYDGVTGAYSSYHTGGGDYEWLEVTYTIDDDAVEVVARFHFNVDASVAYYSQPMFIFGSIIGEGNYIQPFGEVVWCEQKIPLTNFAFTPYTTTADLAINLESETSGKVPKGARAVQLDVRTNDSGSSTSNCYFAVGKDVSAHEIIVLNIGTTGLNLPNDDFMYLTGKVPCNSSGDIECEILASGSLTLDAHITVYGVEV